MSKNSCSFFQLSFAVCLLCAVNLAALALGVFNAINTYDYGKTRTLDETTLRENILQFSSEIEELRSDISASVDSFDAQLESVEGNGLKWNDHTEPMFDSPSGEKGKYAGFTDGFPVYENCTTRSRACSIDGLQLLGFDSSLPRFSHCSTAKDSFFEPENHIADVRCYVDRNDTGNLQPLLSTLFYKNGTWSCGCYGLLQSNASMEAFVNTECRIEVTLCPATLNVAEMSRGASTELM